MFVHVYYTLSGVGKKKSKMLESLEPVAPDEKKKIEKN
jgi:hypothetical protein